MKDKDSYLFTSDREPNQMLRRETITMDVNKVIHSVSNLLPSKPNITIHSFRINMISGLLKVTSVQNTADIIGHQDIRSTISYKRYALSNSEIRDLLEKISQQSHDS